MRWGGQVSFLGTWTQATPVITQMMNMNVYTGRRLFCLKKYQAELSYMDFAYV